METAAAPAVRAVVVGSSGGPGPPVPQPVSQQPTTQQQQQQHNNGNTVAHLHHHQPQQQQLFIQPHQRQSSMAPIVMHRSGEPQSYGKPHQQAISRSAAASPLSPPRPGSGAYSSFTVAPAREAPMRYLQPSPYGAAVPYRENPYARIPNMDYIRAHTPDGSTRPRISLLAPSCGTEYLRPLQPPSDSGSQPLYKKMRLNSGETSTPPAAPQLLKIDTREPPAGAYHPQVEAISPTLPPDHYEDQLKSTKDELLASISKVDREIAKAEIQIFQLKKEEERLKEAAAKPSTGSETESEKEPRHRSLAQKIYADNRKRAAQAHAELSGLGLPSFLPLYQQPRDAQAWRETKMHYAELRPRLLLHFRKLKAERLERGAQLAERYTRLAQEWHRRVDRAESSAKRRAKDAKNREFFEKIFPELRKQREDKERFNRVGARIKSEADLEEIMDGLQEQAMEDKKMRSYAVIPPLPYDSRQRRMTYTNDNGACADMERDYKERQNLNVWTAGEKEIFREKYLQHPKNFGAISACLERKSAQDCVRYYYLNKKTENYKKLLRKSRHRTRLSRSNVNRGQPSGQAASIADALTSGVTTRLQREQQQKTGKREANVSTSALAATSLPKDDVAAVDTNSGGDTSNNSCNNNLNNSNVNTNGAQTAIDSTTVTSVASAPSEVTSEVVTNNMVMLTDIVMTDPPSVPPATPGTPAGAPPIVETETEPAAVPTVPTEAAATPMDIEQTITDPLALPNAKQTNRKELVTTTEAEQTDKADRVNLHNCFICKSNTTQSRLLAKSHATQYGLTEDSVPEDARVCNTCRCKYVRSRLTTCPLPTCPNKDRVKRLRSLPKRWLELPSDIREPIIEEFKISSPNTKCCSACYNRISRRILGLHLQEEVADPGQRLTEEEIVCFKNLLSEHGSQWNVIAESLAKTVYQVKNFYFNYRKKHGLESLIMEYNRKNGIDMKPVLTDEEESGSTTTSCDELDPAASDTASAASPSCNTTINLKESVDIIAGTKNQNSDNKPVISALPAIPGIITPAAPVGKVMGKDEYDSSATETADEENESPTIRQSPKVLLQPVYQSGQQATITVVPNQNSAAVLNQPSRLDSMGDVMLNVIEQMVKNNSATPQKTGSTVLLGKTNSDLSFVRDFRIGEPNVHVPSSASNKLPQNSLATLSVVNSHGHTLQQIPPQQILSTSQIAATITPVGQNSSSSVSNTPTEVPKDVVVVLRSEPEPQTLDLSIKKTRDNSNYIHQNIPPPAHSKTTNILNTPTGSPMNSANVTYRHCESPYSNYHHEAGRLSKSPSVFVPTPPQQQHGLIVQRPGMPITSQSSSKSLSKHNALKMCSKVSLSQTKPGSITHGTPLNQAPSSAIANKAPSPRYDNLLRQTPPDSSKAVGSITQGTPVHLPPHHLQDKRMYDYYSKRQSPAQLSIPGNSPAPCPSPGNFSPYGVQPNSNAPGFTSPYTRPPTYNIEQQLSSRQIIITDYITSQQMHGQGRRPIEKDPVNRGPIAGSPASMFYTDKDRNSRQEYLGRASSAEHNNSVPSPHRTPPPPPQRQGVIQRHNTHSGQTHNSNPPSPAASSKLHHMPSSMHHYPPPGHEAFSSLVDVAVQQPSLPVPHKEDKRPELSAPATSSHHDMRYQQDRLARDRDLQHLHMQQFQQQQQQLQRQQHASRMAELEIHRRQHQQQSQQQQHAAQQHHQQAQAQAVAAAAAAQQQQLYRGHQHQHEREQYYIHRSNLERQQHLEGERERERLRQHQIQNEKERERGAIEKIMEGERSRDLEREERLRRDRETTRLLVGCIPRDATSTRIHDRDRQERDRRERQVATDRGALPVQRSSSPEQLTAAKLIDAIITHQINQTTDDGSIPQTRDGRPNFLNAFHRDHPQLENNGKSHSPNIINVELENSDQHQQHHHQSQTRPIPNVSQKNMTLGDLTDSIITSDFNNPTYGHSLSLRSNYNTSFNQDNIISPDQWKLRRAMQQKEISEREKTSTSNIADERQIIRVAQPPSPRTAKQSQHIAGFNDSITGQSNEKCYPDREGSRQLVTDNRNLTIQSPQQRIYKQPAKHLSAFDYVTNRIVEVMRTEDDSKKSSTEEQTSKNDDEKNEIKDTDRSSTPGDMVIDETADSSGKLETISPSSNQTPAQVSTTYSSTAYNYPYGALNVTTQATKSMDIENAQPKPLMSAQYEPLSDED